MTRHTQHGGLYIVRRTRVITGVLAEGPVGGQHKSCQVDNVLLLLL